MQLDHVVVSRKTPLDGKLEVSASAALKLREYGGDFPVIVGGERAGGRLEALECTCTKQKAGPHVHHFIVSPVLQSLPPGSGVAVHLNTATETVQVDPA